MKLAVASVFLLMGGTLLADSFDEAVSGEDKSGKKANKTLVRSLEALDNIMEDPENYIPPSVIIQSEGIVILPGAFKLAVGVAGGQGARGIAMIRTADRSWSNPFFVTLGEGSLGIQLGAQKSDIVLLFKDKNALMALEETELTLGGDIGVAAGPVSRGASAMTDITFESEIYSYSLSNGLFAGVSIKGGVLTYNRRVNESMYSRINVSTDEIINGIETPFNEEVMVLIDAINACAE